MQDQTEVIFSSMREKTSHIMPPLQIVQELIFIGYCLPQF